MDSLMPRTPVTLGLILAATLVVSGCAGQHATPATAPSPTTAPTPAAVTSSPLSPLQEQYASQMAVEEAASARASGPWTPCDSDAALANEFAYLDTPGACRPLSEDTCDGLYIDADSGGVIDEMIENKDEINETRLKDCPQFAKNWAKAKRGFGEGDWEVGKEVKAGTYETTAHLSEGRVTDCYWERSGANGKTIANDYVTAAKKVRVTIRKSDEMFSSKGCGNWAPVG